MSALLCVVLSAAGFYFSTGLGDQWWLAWLAPVPVLWLAFGERPLRRVFVAAWMAYALGGMSLLRAYAGTIPAPVLIMAIGGPALLFATATIAARQTQRALGSVVAMITFGALWAGLDFLSSFNSAGGSFSSPAIAEIGAPVLIQSAALVGFAGITFLLGVVAAGVALSLRTHRLLPAGIAVVLFCANAAYGYLRTSTPPAGSIRVALINSNETVGAIRKDDKGATLKAIDAYVAEIEKVRSQHPLLIVLPENIARIAPAWRAEAEAKLAIATGQAHATLVAGFNTNIDGAQRNISWAFTPDAPQPVTYQKRRLVPGLETTIFTPGPGPKSLANGTGLEICKDMDFHAMIRADMVATKPRLLAVPAWDFDKDDWTHARIAVMRSVENGLPMARTARDGLLTLNDRYGRVVAVTKTVDGFKTVVGDLPLDGHGGETLYDNIGDIFAWLCLAIGIALVGLSLNARSRTADRVMPDLTQT